MSGSDEAASVMLESIRPLVAGRVSRHGVWLFGAAVVVSAALLFSTLEARRERISAPAIGPAGDEAGGTIASPPELALPAAPQAEIPTALLSAPPVAPPVAGAGAPQPFAPEPARHRQGTSYYGPPPITISTPSPVAPGGVASTSIAPSGPQVVYDAARMRPTAGLPRAEASASGKDAERVEAGRFANPATTIPKGSVMQAVLESMLDSTRAGLARAVISRDVFGFDGSHVLIPRGSRLIGEYKADLAAGQSRALIQWQRLMRPDGAVINLDSPSADPLGRAGIEGKVHSHFAERFAGALLQSALNVGTQVGVSKLVGNAAVVAIPVGQQQVASTLVPDRIQPTLTVKQGTSVSVFVARDLDFTSVEQ